MENRPNGEKNTITLRKAIKWTARWRKLKACLNPQERCRAFNIPKIDLQEVLQEEGVASVRAYMGLQEQIDEHGNLKFIEKLVIVGVDAEGKDMLPVDESNNNAFLFEEDGYVYDFTAPCPDVCDDQSPLNGF